MPHSTNSNGYGATLAAPVRNNYFYGKLLDDHHLNLEQRYLNEKRWLINRLGLGKGVLCGLRLKPAGENGEKLLIEPGVAIDGRGREIIVTEEVCLDNPYSITDDEGRPIGRPTGAVVTICLAFHECDTEPAPVMVADCEVRERCKPGAVRERYKVLLLDGPPKVDSLGRLSSKVCNVLFPARVADRFDRRRAICALMPHGCGRPDEDCVPLAVLRPAGDDETSPTPGDETHGIWVSGIRPTGLEAAGPALGTPGGGLAVDQCGPRTTVYSNVALLELILCLARRVDQCCQAPAGVQLLQHDAGDAQDVQNGQAASKPLVVRVVDDTGTGVDGVDVTFTTQGGGGNVGEIPAGGYPGPPPATAGQTYTDTTSGGGIAKSGYWAGTGPTDRLATVAASLALPSPARIVFHLLVKG